jgi:hypothetical protein
LYGNEAYSFLLRQKVCDFLAANADDFAPFALADEDDDSITPFDDYVKRMRIPTMWGGNTELVAAARMLRVNIVVHKYVVPFALFLCFMSDDCTV